MIKLSVIVPVYNVEEYIEECIDSLVGQTLEDMEIIVVDDESRDGSINKIEKYKDKRIKIVHKKNGGLSSARNYGLKYANGEYIAFVDSDDFLKNRYCLEEMCSIGFEKEADIVVGNSEWYYSNEKIIPYKRDKSIFYTGNIMTGEDYIIRFMNKNCMLRTVWTNIYKKQLFVENNIYFKEGILHEDELFTPQIFLAAKKVTIYEKPFYMYRQRQGSIMNSGKNLKRRDDMLLVCRELNEINNNIQNLTLRKVLGNHISKLIFATIYIYKMKHIDKQYIDIVRKNSYENRLKRKSMILKEKTGMFLIYEKLTMIKGKLVNKI